MSNATLTFTATRSIPAPYGFGDLLGVELTLSAFDRTTKVSKSEKESMSGRIVSTLFYNTEDYSCKTSIKTTESDIMECFFKSTMNGEEFTLTNLDELDRVMTVKRRSGSRARPNSFFVNDFEYEFTVRENV